MSDAIELPDDSPPLTPSRPIPATAKVASKPPERERLVVTAADFSKGPASSIYAGRTPPHSVEAEESVLSCCLLDGGETLAKCLEAGLSSVSFYLPANRVIFGKLCEIQGNGKPVELATLFEELRTSKQLEAVGGNAYLMQVSSRIPTTAQASYFIEKVRELHLLREIVKVSTGTVEEVFNYQGGIEEFTARLQGRIAKLTEASRNGAFTIWTMDDLKKFMPPKDSGLIAENTAYPMWNLGYLATLIGAGGIGKTRLALQLAVAQITHRQWCGLLTLPPSRRWLFVGNENSTTRLKHDLVAMLSALPADLAKRVEEHLFIQVPGMIEDSLIALDDPATLARWRSTLAKIKPDILVVDPWEAVVIGGDVNDAAATRDTVRLLQGMLLRIGVPPTMLLVHHARTGAEATRKAVGYDASSFAKGSKTLFSISRLQINVAAGDDEDTGKLVIACGKCNDAKQFTTRGVKLDEKTQTYGPDDEFDLQGWIDDVEGKRTGKTVTIADVVEAVKDGCHRSPDICSYLKENIGASERTSQRRIKDAVAKGYLQPTQPHGSYTLGDKKLMPAPPAASQ